MVWEDRPYYRDRSGSSTNPLLWLLSGSMPMFTAFGIRVRAHASLLIFIAITIAFDMEKGYKLQYRAFTMAAWVGFVILHEFGHCFAARWMGGTANDVLLWPLGGLAYVDPPHRPLAAFVTAAGGPLVNLLLCVVGAVGFYYATPTASMRLAPHATHLMVSFNPAHLWPTNALMGWSDPAFYFWWLFIINYVLLLFNILPIYPMDGGQMTQAALWPLVGHFRSMLIATTTGMIGSALAGVVSLYFGAWFLVIFCGLCFYYCYQRRIALRENGPDDWRDSIDYSASIYGRTETAPRKRRVGRGAIRRARKIARNEKAQRDRIDAILAKVSARGMPSLSWWERWTLRQATARQRRRELELSRFQ